MRTLSRMVFVLGLLVPLCTLPAAGQIGGIKKPKMPSVPTVPTVSTPAASPAATEPAAPAQLRVIHKRYKALV
ncbi:MAG TPA: hypothetical protein PKA66_06530, partial [Gemmatimonadales bacterium]|nr:hypothetical protein [Gemmatimonadales bacterium]